MEDRPKVRLDDLYTHRDNLPIDPSKIERHEVIPEGLELISYVNGSGVNRLELNLHYQGHNIHSTIAQMPGEEMKEEAERRYKEVLTKLKKGEYKLHLYSDGRFDVEFIS